MTALTYRYVALTDTGLRRSSNQDSGYASSRLLAIADGMGGAAAGDLASSEAMHIIRQLDHDIEGSALDALSETVTRANARLGELIRRDPAVEGMGTTLEIMLFDGEKFAVAHLGDSRAYRLRDGVLTQISDDHTFVQSLVDEGRISREEARVHPHRSLLLRALLGRDDNRADLSWIQPRLGDRYLLCSDGLSDMVDDDVIASALRAENIDFAATELVRLALEAGGVDNVTVVIAEFVDADEPVDPELSCANGQPQLVGAADRQARPRTGAGSSARSPHVEIDPEELRYAPRPRSGRLWVRRTVALLVAVAVVAGACALAYRWTQDQYYVSDQDGKVAIFRGVQVEVPGITLSHVEEVTDISLDSLNEFQRRQIEAGVDASSKDDAYKTVEALDVVVQAPQRPTQTAKTRAPRSQRSTPTATPSAATNR
jgi:serine/threonine protein phosphatase PrpC